MERRKDRRFSANGKAIVVFKPDPILMGQVVDISLGGMAFHYKPRNRTIHDFESLVLICMNNGILKKVPFKKISDVEINDFNLTEIYLLRRASVQFGSLNPKQQEELNTFIERCAVEDSPSPIKDGSQIHSDYQKYNFTENSGQ